MSGTGDSLDLTVIGGYYGKGKRTNVYGAFLLACCACAVADADDEDSETYQSICKIGTGFSEADLDAHYTTLKALELTQNKGYYDVGDAKPDVRVRCSPRSISRQKSSGRCSRRTCR